MNKFLASILAVIAVTSTSAFAGDLRVQNGRFVDSQGATVVLRGFNLSQLHKLPPFRPNNDPLLFQKLAASGVNVVRHQFNWEAYEKAPNVYDESYLDYYAEIVDRAAAAGIYTIIDIHQDAFSRWTLDGCGEGFPLWAIPKGTKVSEPDNGKKCWFWPLRVMAQRADVDALFNKFYAADYMPRERYMILLEKLATRFAGYRNVIGYDLLNEPMGDAILLKKLYVDGIARVRRHDPQAIAFIEPEMLTGSGLESTKLTNPMISNLAFAPHYYDATIYASVWLGGRYEPTAAKNRALAKSWGAAVLLGEYGTPAFALAPNYIEMIYNDMDKFGDSGTQWGYTPEWNPTTLDGWNSEDLSVVDDKGNFRSNYRERPYARRTAGTYGTLTAQPSWFVFPATSSYSWTHNPAQGVTEIFVPKSFFYNRAPIVTTTGGVNCNFNGAKQMLTCSSSSAGVKQVTLK